MLPSILVATDGSCQSESAIGCAAAIARATRARIILLWAGNVVEPEFLVRWVADLRRQSITVEAITFPGSPSAAILRTTRLRGVDLVVMAFHGRGCSPLPLGSVADAVVRRSAIPVLVARSGWPPVERRDQTGGPLVAALLDGSVECEGVLPALSMLRRWMPLTLRLIGVTDLDDSARLFDLATRVQSLAAVSQDGGRLVESWAVPTTDAGACARGLLEEGAVDLLSAPVRGDWPGEGGSFGPLTSSLLNTVSQPLLFIRVERFFPLGSMTGCCIHN